MGPMPLTVTGDFAAVPVSAASPATAGTDVTTQAAYRRALEDLVLMEEGIATELYGAASLAAARVMLAAMRATTAFRDHTGTLRGSMGAGSRGTTVRVGNLSRRIPNTGAAVWAGSPHAHLLAFGTADRFTRTGASRGRGPATDFMTKAAQASATAGFEAGFEAARRKFGQLRQARGAAGAPAAG